MPQALEHGAACFQRTHLSKVQENQGNVSVPQLPMFNSILFCRRWVQVVRCFKCVDLSWSVLRSGGEQMH